MAHNPRQTPACCFHTSSFCTESNKIQRVNERALELILFLSDGAGPAASPCFWSFVLTEAAGRSFTFSMSTERGVNLCIQLSNRKPISMFPKNVRNYPFKCPAAVRCIVLSVV